jgi:adhesin transport system membrane fusion protein
VEVLRLQRQKSDLELKLTDVRSQYYVQAREALSKANAEVDMVSAVLKGREDSVTRLTVKSPVRGIVKNIKVTTIGGVIPPNGELMEIVPVDDHLLIETRLSPRDIAFIHPNQEALVKITAYDYAIYGGLHGVVKPFRRTPFRTKPNRVFYYRVFIRTSQDYLSIKRAGTFRLCRDDCDGGYQNRRENGAGLYD